MFDDPDQEQQLQQVLAILTEGIEVVEWQHGIKHGRDVPIVNEKQLMWMEMDILRLCVAPRRPTLQERKAGKMAAGIYIRDLAAVRSGRHTYIMDTTQEDVLLDDDAFLTLIGSERSFCLQFPTQFARDWFAKRIELIQQDTLSTEEMKSLISDQVLDKNTPLSDDESSLEFLIHLVRGMEILWHDGHGKTRNCLLTADQSNTRLVVTTPSKFSFYSRSSVKQSIAFCDVASLRSGIHSFGFLHGDNVATLNKDACLSVVGSTGAVCLEFPSSLTQGVFALKFKQFLTWYTAKYPEGISNDHLDDFVAQQHNATNFMIASVHDSV